MKHLDDWHELLCKEIDKLYEKGGYESGNELNPQTLEVADKALHALKSLKTYEAMEDAGYSEASYGDGGSYGRGRMNVRRDGMGRYSRDDGMYRGGSYRMGYSRGDDDMYDDMYRREMMYRR